ncbi:16S rRNA (cytosine(967)-C(5))-methyltransferase RsmB [Candidatus Eisenbacteria bacterium]|uniref:16S rRNA (cytosine(967)-C(5))-methyltransferase n=1 Tax=Eiseniibacteriota bacterium TaxID=2212470 RepID=A0ABV6YJV6_UNCEI
MLDARALALDILVKCESRSIPTDLELAARLGSSGLEPRDRKFVTSLVRTTLRWRGRADAVLDRRLARGLRSLSKVMSNVLRLAYVQLFHIEGIPARAVVHTAVELARLQGGEGMARLANSVLRQLIRVPPTSEDWSGRGGSAALEGELSHPAWLLNRWIRQWGIEKTRRLCSWNNGTPSLHLRVRGDESQRKAVVKELEESGLRCAPGELLEETLRVDGHFPVGSHPRVKDGTITLQDESQALVGHLWPQPLAGVTLDLCAAPGTKCSHVAQLNPEGSVLAMDSSLERARMIAATKIRLDLRKLHVIVGDGRRPPLGGAYPRVLLDAPCSGLGVLRRRPDARWLRSGSEIVAAAKLQRQLLERAATLVAPGGSLLYSVCTLEPEETEQRVSGFLKRQPRFRPGELPDWLPEEVKSGDGVVRVFPGTLGMEGLFAALMRKDRDA